MLMQLDISKIDGNEIKQFCDAFNNFNRGREAGYAEFKIWWTCADDAKKNPKSYTVRESTPCIIEPGMYDVNHKFPYLTMNQD